MVQTKRGSKVIGGVSSIEATLSPVVPRGRWARSSRTPAEAKGEIVDEVELKKVIADMKLGEAKLKYQYELALEVFDRQRDRAWWSGRRVSKAMEDEYLRAWDAYDVEASKRKVLEFKLRDCVRLHDSQSCRTASSEVSEDPSEDFHRRPSSV